MSAIDHLLTLCGFHYEMYIGISTYRTLAVDWTQYMVVLISHSSCRLNTLYGSIMSCDLIVWENTNVAHFSWDMWKYSTRSMGTCLKAHTLLIERVLYFPTAHSNEHRLHIFIHLFIISLVSLVVTNMWIFNAGTASERVASIETPRAQYVSCSLDTLWQWTYRVKNTDILAKCS